MGFLFAFDSLFYYSARTNFLVILTLFMMGLFGAAHGSGEGGSKKASLPKICHTYLTIMKLGTVISYLKKIQKIFESRDTPLAFC